MDRTLDEHRTHRCNSMKRVVEWYTGLHWTDRWVCGEHQSSWQWGGAGHREVSKTSLVVCRCWEWQLEQGSLRLSQSPSHTSQVLVTCYGYQWQQLKSKLYQIKSCSHACKSPLLQHMRQIKSLLALFSAWEALWRFFWYALAKVTKDYMVCRRQMIWSWIMWCLEPRIQFWAAVWSILIQNQCTHMQMLTYTSAEANPGGLSPLFFEIPGTF